MELTNRQALVMMPSPTVLLAQSRTDSAERPGHRQAIQQNLHRLTGISGCQRIEKAGDIETGGTLSRTGCDAVPSVIGEQELESHSAGSANILTVGGHFHSVSYRHRAGW